MDGKVVRGKVYVTRPETGDRRCAGCAFEEGGSIPKNDRMKVDACLSWHSCIGVIRVELPI